ncbi:hypothetical protein JOC86_002800 [Bacillus pakistanensis]|uniref:DUF1871 domain-containing protein n=1 Tax=Rossellomorea pakistanensis TaxID=992288 RepID=A0ABS2NEI3_9BACI|nr:DUF1871 family protein [Bacillus pakistanensis]MBM7586258.1 hypothetical protein [Bacillus pakistanensis]
MEQNMRATNEMLFITLQEWDPFSIGKEGYDTEIADSIAAVHRMDHPNELAKKIQEIYEFSFEEWIPMESCLKVAYKLIEIKNTGSCSL